MLGDNGLLKTEQSGWFGAVSFILYENFILQGVLVTGNAQ